MLWWEDSPRGVTRKKSRARVNLRCGGEGGIRTHGRISPTHAFQACSLNRSDTSPVVEALYQFSRKRRIAHRSGVNERGGGAWREEVRLRQAGQNAGDRVFLPCL